MILNKLKLPNKKTHLKSTTQEPKQRIKQNHPTFRAKSSAQSNLKNTLGFG
jgi:hypothetical protein